MRSVFDRTLFVLGRAAAVAAPAGLIIWISANIKNKWHKHFSYCSDFLDPLAHLFGMDGVILTAFILGFPANETVVPIMLMGYLADSGISQTDGAALHTHTAYSKRLGHKNSHMRDNIHAFSTGRAQQR